MKKQIFSFNHKFNNNPRNPGLIVGVLFYALFVLEKSLKNFSKSTCIVAVLCYNEDVKRQTRNQKKEGKRP